MECGWSYASKKRKKVKKGESVDLELNRKRAVRHARTVIRRKIMNAGLDYLLTLTYKDNMCDFEKASDDQTEFCKIVRSKIPDWKYLAVLERQERGAYHWHIAVKGWQNVILLREIWLSVVGSGNIDVRSPKQGKRARWGRLGLAYYLVKYIGKEMGIDYKLNKKSFRSSKDVEEPEVTRVTVTNCFDIDSWVDEMFNAAKVRIRCRFHSDNGMFGWACSWDVT